MHYIIYYNIKLQYNGFTNYFNFPRVFLKIFKMKVMCIQENVKDYVYLNFYHSQTYNFKKINVM